jgi:hypothetical protein
MPTFYPVFITASIFIALVIDDFILGNSDLVLKNSVEGLITTFLMLILSFYDMELVSWGLLFLFLVIIVASYYTAKKTSTVSTVAKVGTIPAVPAMSCPVAGSGQPSTISNPATMSASVNAQPYAFTPITACER